MRENIQYIYFDSPHTQLAITKEGYQQIKQTIERYRVCGNCGCLFTHENPQVSLNWCKTCFVREGKGKSHGLTYIGMLSPEPKQYKGIEYQFIAPDGYIYITGSEADTIHDMTHYNKNNRQTLKHWQFPALPELYDVNGEETRLHDSYMHIYGDMRKDVVVFVNYSETHNYSASIHLPFVAYRNTEEPQEFNKRKGEGRKLWIAAKARLEASKDARGDYHIGPWVRSFIYEEDVYYFLTLLLNEQEALKALEQRKALAAQPINPDIKPGETIQLSLTAYDEARLAQLQANRDTSIQP